MVMILQLILVAANLPIKLVHQLINGRIEIRVTVFHKNVLAFDVEGNFSLWPR